MAAASMSTGGAYNNPLAPPADGDFFDDLDAFWDVVGTGGASEVEEDGSGMDASALDALMGLATPTALSRSSSSSPHNADNRSGPSPSAAI